MRGVLDEDLCDRLSAICTLAERLLQAPKIAPEIDGAAAVAAYFRPRLALQAVESFWVLMLDARARPIGATCVAQGTLTACLVHPREVFAPALRARAASIIVVHNHPSGDPQPSEDDGILTERLTRAGHVLGIPLVDHVVVARGGFQSIGPVDVTDAPLWTGRVTSARA
jgi:DNA repair protein RadC